MIIYLLDFRNIRDPQIRTVKVSGKRKLFLHSTHLISFLLSTFIICTKFQTSFHDKYLFLTTQLENNNSISVMADEDSLLHRLSQHTSNNPQKNALTFLNKGPNGGSITTQLNYGNVADQTDTIATKLLEKGLVKGDM